MALEIGSRAPHQWGERLVVQTQVRGMSFFRQYIAPLFIVLIFLVAMVAVSARIFLPSDLAAPAPIEEPSALGDSMTTMAMGEGNESVLLAQFYSPTSKTEADTAQTN